MQALRLLNSSACQPTTKEIADLIHTYIQIYIYCMYTYNIYIYTHKCVCAHVYEHIFVYICIYLSCSMHISRSYQLTICLQYAATKKGLCTQQSVPGKRIAHLKKHRLGIETDIGMLGIVEYIGLREFPNKILPLYMLL
jgi:hypothetical protein